VMHRRAAVWPLAELFRTTEDAIGIDEYAGHAKDEHLRVKTMTPCLR